MFIDELLSIGGSGGFGIAPSRPNRLLGFLDIRLLGAALAGVGFLNRCHRGSRLGLVGRLGLVVTASELGLGAEGEGGDGGEGEGLHVWSEEGAGLK